MADESSLDGRTLVGVANDDGRVRVEDEWEWESKPGSGESVLEEAEQTG